MLINAGTKVQKKIEPSTRVAALFTLLHSVLMLFNTIYVLMGVYKLFNFPWKYFFFGSVENCFKVPFVGSFGNSNFVRCFAILVNIFE